MGGRFDIWKRSFRMEAGLPFATAVLAQTAVIYDKVIFIDPKRGSDGADGSDWSHAVQSINGACALCYGGNCQSETYARGRGAFAFIYRSYLTGGDAYTTQQIISVDGVHLIGAGQWYGAGAGYESTFVLKGPNLTADTELTGLRSTYAGLLVKADSVIIDGIKFYIYDPTHSPYCVAFSDMASWDSPGSGHAGRNIGVFNCEFQGDQGGGGTAYGVGLCGTEAPTLAGNKYRYLSEGISLGGGTIRYANGATIEHERMYGVARGIAGVNASVWENQVDDIRIMQKAGSPGYGYALVAGIDWTSGTYNYMTNCFVNHLTKNTAFVPGTENFWHRCWFGDTGAKATEYDGT